jgi:hypothetical protein
MRLLPKLMLLAVSGVALTALSAYAAEPNTETTVAPARQGALFAISVDGEHVAGTKVPQDAQRKNDLALEAVDIQVKFDGLDVRPVLNVSTAPIRQSYKSGDKIDFLASWNYPGWLEKAELRIFDAKARRNDLPVATVPVTPDGAATWQMPNTGSGHFAYVLRVYDAQGRFDETVPLSLSRSGADLPQHEPQDGAVAPGYGEDRTATRNIPVYGGAVTVYGKNLPQGQSVTVMGERIPVDANGSFVVQRLLPPGDHAVDVEIEGRNKSGLSFNRTINIPSSEWFYVALADFTLGKRFGSGAIEDVKPGDFEGVYTKGRLAFYLKGKIKGRYLLTAAADTGEDDVKNLFKGLDEKDPRQFLRRIDPDDYYPVYGDDSTSIEDAPTRGKVYVRLERGNSHVMWGNFKTEIRGTELLRNERALYGASGVYKSDRATSFGESTADVRVYAAQPGTLPQRDVLRGTGGSAYFLKHQDITIGSETVSVEIRDRISGRVLERKQLRYTFDYDIDYLQGVIILKTPLNSSSAVDGTVRDGALGGNDVYLIANYEFTPASTDVDGYVYGGRAQSWLGDHLRIGVTGATEKTGAADQKLAGIDIAVRKSEQTYIEAEIARSKGPGFGNAVSTDGGLTIIDQPTAGRASREATAMRIHARASLGELTNEAAKGDLEAYFEKVQEGFSSLERQVTDDETKWGAKGDLELTDNLDFILSYDEFESDNGKHDRQLDSSLAYEFIDGWTIAAGATLTKRDLPLRAIDGQRVDVGAKLTRNFDEQNSAYVFGQVTADRKGDIPRNDRVGVGGTHQLTEKVSLSAEGSYGSGGVGGRATVDYKPTADDHYYLGYTLDPERQFANEVQSILQGDDLGGIVVGARRKYSEQLSAYAEDKYDLFGRRPSLTQTYGVNYTPDAAWTITGTAEIGTIWDDTVDPVTGAKNSDFDRKAISLAVGFHPNEKIDGKIKGEARFDNSEDDTRDSRSYYFGAGINYKVDDDWRILLNLDAVLTDATATTRDGDYVEGSFGYAYRPTTNDRLNALFKYTFLYDNPGFDQVTATGSTAGPSQLSHILSADATYDLTPLLSIGGKYGFRIGETREREAGSDWEKSSAHLGIIRADFHVEKNWDVLLEGRAFWNPGDESVDFGALAAVYRHMGDNFKVGVGYNFGHFSDDLRDLEADDYGVFINAIGQF